MTKVFMLAPLLSMGCSDDGSPTSFVMGILVGAVVVFVVTR